jgi:type IV secretory pathway TrbD component
MTHFPAVVHVPRGLVVDRQVCGLPPLIWMSLFLVLGLLFALLMSLGMSWRLAAWYGGCAVPLVLIVWAYVAYEARHDPRFVQAWVSELSLKARYE